jgi:hypothetical protein
MMSSAQAASYKWRLRCPTPSTLWLCCDDAMDRTTTHDPAVAALAGTTKPRGRRWSDGPNYAWSPASEDDWSIATHWPGLVAAMGEDVANRANDFESVVERLREQGKLSRADLLALRQTLQAMRSNAIALQQIVRLGAGQFNLSPDRVDLATLARATVRERQRELVQRRAEVGCALRRAEVWVDGAVAAGLMQAGIDWALSFSRKVRIKVLPGDGEEPARVVIRGALAVASATPHGNRRMNDNLHWVLLRQLADYARVSISRSSSAATESVVMEFPAALPGLA